MKLSATKYPVTITYEIDDSWFDGINEENIMELIPTQEEIQEIVDNGSRVLIEMKDSVIAEQIADKALSCDSGDDPKINDIVKSNEHPQEKPWLDVKESHAQTNKDDATFACAHQWVSVEDALPDESEEVLCMMKSNGAVVSGFIFRNKKGIPEVATDSCFHFEDYGGYEPTHWMHKPQLNNERNDI